MKFKSISALVSAAGLAAGAALADDINMDRQLSWTAYGTTTSGYAQSIAIGQMLKEKYDVGLRVIPGKNDVSRMIPLRTGQADLCACGMSAYMAAEGTHMYSARNAGPMQLYNLFNSFGDNGQHGVVAADAGIEKVSDIRGKRVIYIKGAPAQNMNMEAFLAFGGLTWDDVERVVVPGWAQGGEAIANGQADVLWTTTVTAALNKLAASPRGLFWVELDHSDDEAWKRAQAIAPHWKRHTVTLAIDGEKNPTGKMPFQGNTFPYPIFVGSENLTEDNAYGLTKAVMTNYDKLKDAAPGMSGYQLDRQKLDWIFPYHPGAIKFYEEEGLWTDEMQAHNDKLLERMALLQETWQQHLAENEDLDDEAFTSSWQEARAAALEAAGMNVIFETW